MAAANCQRTFSGVRRSISPHRPMMCLLPSASPPGTPPRSAMLKSWTTCVRCSLRRNSPAVTRWSSVERTNSICPFPACPRRESISSLPVLCSTLIFIRLWSVRRSTRMLAQAQGNILYTQRSIRRRRAEARNALSRHRGNARDSACHRPEIL